MTTKIIPIILLVVILGIGAIAFNFYSKNQDLTANVTDLEKARTELTEANSNLNYRYNQADKDKKQLEQRVDAIQKELAAIEKERDDWKQKWTAAAKERDELLEKTKHPSAKVEVSQGQGIASTSEEHWADVVAKKADLEARLASLNATLLDTQVRMAELEKNNKELSIKIDEITKERERLEEAIGFKERALRVLSMDLVSEREERSSAVTELKKLRNENLSLKRELVLASKDKMRLQGDLKDIVQKKEGLEDRIADAETFLKDKSMTFNELQEDLKTAIAGGKQVTASESASVELPPIVVKPSAPGMKGVRGEVIAVNKEENFIVVDLGEASGLRPGALLKVMRGNNEIGEVEIIETRKEISAADIKQTVSGLTVQEGDIVITQ